MFQKQLLEQDGLCVMKNGEYQTLRGGDGDRNLLLS